jgi:hypothetical protein
MTDTGTGRAGPVENVYRMVREAVETRKPISAVYQNHYRLLCPHRLGRNKRRAVASAVLSVWRRKHERSGGGGIARQLALHCAGEAQRGGTSERRVANSPQPLSPGILHSRC